MVELKTLPIVCCTPTAQESCCETSEKSTCCASGHPEACGCSASRTAGEKR